ncbi:MAG: molecular chaperone TorD family protein [Deltaproteobacteria bacterium]|nr:molecular chaperone TorD family protein [Deltaproteobacteria bacterium]
MENAGGIEALKVRSNMYSLLSRVFIREVDKPFLHLLKDEESAEAFRDSGFSFCDDFTNKKNDDILDELAVEYAALFLISTGKELSPYESVQLSKEGQLCGEAASKSLAFYKSEGFDLPLENNFFPDHFAVELEFMAHLCKKETKARESNEEEIAESVRTRQVEFINAHLGRWYRNFLNTVEISTESPFYRGMSLLAREFLDSERESLSVKNAGVSSYEMSVL